MKMTDEDFAQYQSFMLDKKQYTKTQTPEQREKFYEQVKQRVVRYLEAIEKHDLRAMLANQFWGSTLVYDEITAWREAHELGWKDGSKENPYAWYLLLKPHARMLAKSAKEFTQHFEK